MLAIKKFFVPILFTLVSLLVSLNHAKHDVTTIGKLFQEFTVSQIKKAVADEKSVKFYNKETNKTNKVMRESDFNKKDFKSLPRSEKASFFTATKNFLAKLL